MKKLFLLSLFLLAVPAYAQYPASCTSGQVAFNSGTGHFAGCFPDGTWTDWTGSAMSYPGAGIPNSTGSAWGNSYTVGTAASNLVQLTAAGALPAVSAANLTNFPTLNQNTTGNAATATALAAAPSLCSAGNVPTGIAANGNATGCAAVVVTGGQSVAFLSADASPGSTTNTLGSSGMTFSISANTKYTLECQMMMQVSTTSGVGFTLGVTGPGSPTEVTLAMDNWTSQTARRSEWSQGTAWAAKLGATATTYSSNPLPVTFTGLIENGSTAGTLTIEYANIGTTGTTTLKRGSWCKLQ